MEQISIPAVPSRREALAAALLLPFATFSPERQASPSARRAGPQFQSKVDVVRLSVTARDAAGRIVHDLCPEEFEIYENSVRQQVEHFGHHETPISVVLLFDKSESMSGDKLMHAKGAIINFINALKTGDEALVLAFSDSVDALGGFGLDCRAIERAMEFVAASRGTCLWDAVVEGARHIAAPGRQDKRALVVLSDGADTSSWARLDEAVEAVRMAEAPVYAIAIGYSERPRWPRGGDSLWGQLREARDFDALCRLTESSGGRTYPVQAARRCKEICLRIADELRNQYVLAYYPTNQDCDGVWRTIEVRTTRPRVTLATRSGYYAPPGDAL